MKLVFCLDDAGGIAFNKRRQSRDRVLCEDVLKYADTEALAMSEYSAKLFDYNEKIRISDEPSENDTYFLELRSPDGYIKDADAVVIYRWNRLYLSDVRFTSSMSTLGFKLESREDFVGFSHEKITKETYIKV